MKAITIRGMERKARCCLCGYIGFACIDSGTRK
jgi:hypothetical protein